MLISKAECDVLRASSSCLTNATWDKSSSSNPRNFAEVCEGCPKLKADDALVAKPRSVVAELATSASAVVYAEGQSVSTTPSPRMTQWSPACNVDKDGWRSFL